MGPTCTSGRNHVQPTPCLTPRPHQVRLPRTHGKMIRLERTSFSAPRDTGCCLQTPNYTYFVGTKSNRCMVYWARARLLPLQSLLHPGHQGVSYLRYVQTLSYALLPHDPYATTAYNDRIQRISSRNNKPAMHPKISTPANFTRGHPRCCNVGFTRRAPHSCNTGPTVAPTEGAPNGNAPHHVTIGDQPATTVDHTTRPVIQAMPCTHMRTTQNNTPGQTLTKSPIPTPTYIPLAVPPQRSLRIAEQLLRTPHTREQNSLPRIAIRSP